jgi:hypothetical protein
MAVTVSRPTLTDEERERRMKEIEKAAARLMHAVMAARKQQKEEGTA